MIQSCFQCHQVISAFQKRMRSWTQRLAKDKPRRFYFSQLFPGIDLLLLTQVFCLRRWWQRGWFEWREEGNWCTSWYWAAGDTWRGIIRWFGVSIQWGRRPGGVSRDNIRMTLTLLHNFTWIGGLWSRIWVPVASAGWCCRWNSVDILCLSLWSEMVVRFLFMS